MNRWAVSVLGVLILGMMLDCTSSGLSPSERIAGRILIEVTDWKRLDGRNVHGFTMVNTNDIVVRRVVVRMDYMDLDGKVVNSVEKTFHHLLDAHDAVRHANVDGGPTHSMAFSTRYTVLKARAVYRRSTK